MIPPRIRPKRDVIADYDLAKARRLAATTRLLGDVRDRVLEAYAAYEDAGGSPKRLRALEIDTMTKNALVGSYGLTYEPRPLSSLRFDVLDAAYEGMCPMCGEGQVSTLDHYLPKEKFPEFSILASNLIPACSDCNHNKLSFLGSEEEGFFPHAYFGDLASVDSMFDVRVCVENEELVVLFSVNDQLPQPLYRDFSVQFEKLRLASRYAWAAKREILERLDTFHEARMVGGRDYVAATAGRQCRVLRRRFGRHYWKAALYEGIERSGEFCDSRFEQFMTI